MKDYDRRWLIAGIVLLVFVAAGLVLGVLLYGNADAATKRSMQFELFKYGLQLCVIVVIGGGVALLYKLLERSWDARREQSDRRKDYVSRLGDAYRAVKEARRLLRASGITHPSTGSNASLSDEQVTRYDEQVIVINRQQLELEALRIESRNFPPVEDSTRLTAEIRSMERYLGQIIDEYEDVRPGAVLDLSMMRRISEFTGESDVDRDRRLGTFQENFVKPHYRAINILAGRPPEGSSGDD